MNLLESTGETYSFCIDVYLYCLYNVFTGVTYIRAMEDGRLDSENVSSCEQDHEKESDVELSTRSITLTQSAQHRPLQQPRIFACACYSFGQNNHIAWIVWEQWKTYNGPIEYYLYSNKDHSGISFRQSGGEQSVARADIVVASEKEWVLRVRVGDWQPKAGCKVISCTHNWHAASLFKGVLKHAKTFGRYNSITNNCTSWTKSVPSYLRKNYSEVACERIDDWGNFCRWAIEELQTSVTASHNTS